MKLALLLITLLGYNSVVMANWRNETSTRMSVGKEL